MEILFQTNLLKQLPTFIIWMFVFYLVCKVLDFGSGILKCLTKNGTGYKSSKMRYGIIKWIAELIAVTFVIGIDLLLGLNYLLCGFTLSLFIFKEGGSIIENIGECGVDMPDAIKDKLEIFNVNKTGKLPIEDTENSNQ
ncbi:phage holin family protein [Clostridium butyricum]|uniref:phage holin family protein n=1 Tax=Clostridium butyricum TaxID=1492 RepID=UPI003D0B7E50